MPGISDIAVSSSGNLYATGTTNGAVYKITAAGSVTGVKSGFNFGEQNGIVVDKNSNLYITILGSNPLSQINTITKIDASGVVSTFTTGLDGPCGLLMDVNGNFFIVNTLNGNTLNGTVSKLTVQ
jgi:sugar lactone lactonase YvrE